MIGGEKKHGQDAHVTVSNSDTGILPVGGNVGGNESPQLQVNESPHGQDAHVTVSNSDTGILPVGGNVGGNESPQLQVNESPHGQDAHVTFEVRQGAYLPHWTLSHGGIYAVTFRLADSLPKMILERLLRERETLTRSSELSKEDTARAAHLHSEKIEAYLDAGSGECWLKCDGVSALMTNALKHFDGVRYRLHAWCVMPNHVHVLVEPLTGHRLIDIVHSWKSFVANGANRLLKRSGAFWQPEYYDHLIRDEADYAHAVWYIGQNPLKAGLANWPWVGRGTGFQPVVGRGTGFQPVESHQHG